MPEPRRFEPHPHPGSWPSAGMGPGSALVRACVVFRITPRYLRILPAAAAVVAAAVGVARIADAGARARTWRGEWERGKWVARSKC